MDKKNIVAAVFMLFCILSATGMDANNQKVNRLAERPLLSPRNNIFYKDTPRDLYFIVHENEHTLVSVTRNGEQVEYGQQVFQNSHMPTAIQIHFSKEEIIEFGSGHHVLLFTFDNGSILDVGLDVIGAGEGVIHDMKIITFNVGHGDAVLIFLPNGETLMIDTGTESAARNYTVPFLRTHLPVGENGRQKIDYVFISHWHYDHFHGLGPLLDEFEIGQVRYNLFKPPNAYGDYNNRPNPNDPYGYGEYGFAPQHWPKFAVGNTITGIGGDDVEIKILNSPLFNEIDERYMYYHSEHFESWDNRNNRSLAFNLKYHDFVFNFGGDVYQHAQRAMLHAFPEEVASTHIYHGNHHFHGGIEVDFLKALDPYLFFASACEAAYDRVAFTRDVMNDAVPYLEEYSERFIENLHTFEVGHTVIRINGSKDWTDPSVKLPYETYFTRANNYRDYIVPYLYEGFHYPPKIIKDIPGFFNQMIKEEADTFTVINLHEVFETPAENMVLNFSVMSNNNPDLAEAFISCDNDLKVIVFPDKQGFNRIVIQAADSLGKYAVSPFRISVYDPDSENLLLNRIPSASSSHSSAPVVHHAVDGNLSTRWSSDYADNQWLAVEMEEIKTIQRVMIRWETAYGKDYEIQLSDDGLEWTTVYHEPMGNGGWDRIIFDPAEARFVRMMGNKRATQWGFSIYSFEAYPDIGEDTGMLPSSQISQNVMIYPNPAEQYLNIKTEEITTDAEIIIYNITGQTVLSSLATSTNNTAFNHTIDISSLKNGIYLLMVVSDHFLAIRQFIKR